MEDWNWTMTIVMIVAILVGIFVGLLVAPKQTGSTFEEVEAYADKQVANAISPLNTKISELETEITELLVVKNETEKEEEEEQEKIEAGYLIDGLFLEEAFNIETFSDRELVTLFDGKVSFDGEDYDAEEVLTLENLVLKANENDFEGIPYLTVPTYAIEFALVFEDDLDTDLIDDDETLTFKLFGDKVEISDWDLNEITFTRGTEHSLGEGDSITVDEKVIVLDMVLEDAVYVLVDGVGEKIEESDTETVNGVDIKVNEVLYTTKENQVSKATLTIGEEVEITVSDGDEYEEDSIWEWVIDTNTVGLVLIEEFTELEEDFSALTNGDKVCLPNEYACVLFNGVIEEDSEEYTFELDTKNTLEYVEVNGNFQNGIEDYDKIYVNATGIYDEDFDLIGTEVELGDTDLVLDMSTGDIVIEDFEVNLDLDVTNVGTGDENVLTDYGILIDNPEDSIDDEEFTIVVPESKLESSISLI